MSLWSKPMSQVTIDDIAAFKNVPEGQRLDYKVAVDSSLNKVVCAFANTLGGIVILGVEVDRSTNLPIWPPKGIPKNAWSTEQITQICSDGIYPPVLPSISAPLVNPADPNTIVAALRVDQSREAPHSIDQSTKVLVRYKDIAKRFDGLAHVDKIAQMLRQRDELSAKGELLIQQNLDRAHRYFQPKAKVSPIVWCNVGPLYPWQDIFQFWQCINFPNEFELHGAPGGAIGFDNVKRGTTTVRHTLVSVNANGHAFRADVLNYPESDGAEVLDWQLILCRAQQFFRHVDEFCEERRVNHPGLVKISMGMENIALRAMQYVGRRGPSFPDAQFLTEEVISYDEFHESWACPGTVPQFLQRIAGVVSHAFALPL